MKLSFPNAALAALFSVSLFCGNFDAAYAQSEKCDVTIGVSRLRISLPIFVADHDGLFAKAGIHPCLQFFDTAQPMTEALMGGRLDVAGYTALPITFSGMARSGKKFYFVTTMLEDQRHRISYLMKQANSPIHSIADLKGKSVGILPTIAYKVWLTDLLKSAGVDSSTVTIQMVAPNLEAQTLKSGGVDALFTNDPVASAALRSGSAELINNYVEIPKLYGEPFPFGSFNVSKTWADAHRPLFKRLVKAIDDAVEQVDGDPKSAKEAMRSYLQPAFQGDVDRYPDAYYWTSDDSKDAAYTKAMQQYLKSGIIDAAVNLNGLVVHGSRLK